MNELLERVLNLEAEKLNWIAFQNYFESQLKKFFFLQNLEACPQNPRSERSRTPIIGIQPQKQITNTTQPVQFKKWNISKIDSTQSSADRYSSSRVNSSNETRRELKNQHQSEPQKVAQAQKAVSTRSANFDHSFENANSLQVQLQLDSDNLHQLEIELKKKKQVIDKQREYIKLIDQEVGVFKQSILLKKDQEIERKTKQIKSIQDQNVLLIQESHNQEFKIKQLKQENLNFMQSDNLLSQKLKELEKQYKKTNKLTIKDLEAKQNFIEQITKQYNIHEDKDLLKILKNIDEKQKFVSQIQRENRDLVIKLEDSNIQKEQCNRDKIELKLEYQGLFNKQIEELVQVRKAYLTHKTELLSNINELNKQILATADLIQHLKDQQQTDESTIELLQRHFDDLKRVGSQLQFKVNHLEMNLSSESQQHNHTRSVLVQDKRTLNQQIDDLKQTIVNKDENTKLKKEHDQIIIQDQQKSQKEYEGIKLELQNAKELLEKNNLKSKEEYQNLKLQLHQTQDVHEKTTKQNKDEYEVLKSQVLKTNETHEKSIQKFKEQNDELKVELLTKESRDNETPRDNDKSESDQSIQFDYKKMTQMKEKLTNQTKSLESYSKKVGVVLSNMKHVEGEDNVQLLFTDISVLVDSINEIQAQISVEQERKLTKEMDKQRGLLQQNIQLKIDNKKIEFLTQDNINLQRQIEDLQKEIQKLQIDNKNLMVLAKRDSQLLTPSSIDHLQHGFREHRRSMVSVLLPNQHPEGSQTIYKLQNEYDVTKKDLVEAQEIIQKLISDASGTVDRQVNYLNKRVIDLQNQIKQKTSDLENQIKEQDKQRIQYDEEIDRLEDDVEERDERLQDFMKEQLEQQ